MIKYKVSKSQSLENIPLLYSDEFKSKIAKKDFTIKSATIYTKMEWEVFPDENISGSSEMDSLDFAELNNCQAIFHIIKASIGTGVLALPSALRYSGILFGTLSILILSMISIYSTRLLLQVVAHLRLTTPKYIRNLDYEKTVKLCFENINVRFHRYSWIRHLLVLALSIGQIGNLSSYHIFVAENTKALVDNYIKEGFYIFPLYVYQLLFFFLLCPLLFIKTLDKLSYCTHAANIFMVISLVISLVYCLQDPLPIGTLPLIKVNDATPLFFGIVIFSFESINLINPVESHMKKKTSILNFCGVLNVATSIVLVTYLIVGICGYWKFGDNIESSLILSIPMEPWYYMLCKPLYILSILVSYALQGYVMFCLIWKKFEYKLHSNRSRRLGSIAIRIGLVFTSTLLSIAVPHFDLFISFVGAISGAFLSLIFPSICNSLMVLSFKANRFWRLQLFINAIIFTVGIAGCLFGTYSSVVNIIRAFQK